MFVLEKPRSVLQQGFTCVCGHALPGTTHYRTTCPKCQQVYTLTPTPAQGDDVGLCLTALSKDTRAGSQ